eukprot:2262292-Rhodomonas_salina.1
MPSQLSRAHDARRRPAPLLGGQPGMPRRLGREAAGACVPGWRLSPCLHRVRVRLCGGEGGVWAAEVD